MSFSGGGVGQGSAGLAADNGKIIGSLNVDLYGERSAI
ncbi:hypothetical protein D515_03926 [Grimontia indica]|uniref:Uncharacterized protein n=1 Tax=Grimontia indica TaxID=1056512 RepID=R1I9L0_9GAMM|nr:hypothetical protein D515_03926 [Grimontia indica]